MKSIRFRFLVAALAVVLGAAISKAQTTDTTPSSAPAGHGHRHGMRGPMMDFPFKQLNLTDAQKAQVKELMQKEHSTMKPLMQQMHQMDQQIKQYSESTGTFDETKVQALVTPQAQTLVQLKVEQARIHNELYQLLTPDQQTKMKEIEANREARMQQHMHSKPASAPQQ
ncbi:MAG TPA: Spy/CpxP family protein refolding chaperone [Candidatus Acidoferrum sp.]|nr:Spy/CpxP family protein refolding chaperone [Candidatus Acidoferrum sp.]